VSGRPLVRVIGAALCSRDHAPPQVRDGRPNGILLDYQVMRHMVDLEAIHTFEGTETMQTLIVGRAITGIGAFT
jgi:alkylation response protein AidB-like acyl-CoA dehydrogenase